MTSLQPILGLALAMLCACISGIPPNGKRLVRPNLWSAVALGVLLGVSAFCAFRLGQVDDRRAVLVNLTAGFLVTIVCTVLSELSVGVGIALATAGACVPHIVRADSFPEVGLAFAYSVAMGAMFFGSSKVAVAAGVTGSVIAITDYMGKSTDEGVNKAIVGFAIGLALSVAAIIAVASERFAPKAMAKVQPIFISVLAAAAGYAVSKWALGGELWIILGIAAVSGLIVHWLTPPEGEPAPLRVGIAVAIWLALGTISFSMLRGFGMSAAMLEALAVLALLGNFKAMPTIGPALGLVMYRALRDASPDSSKALDLGQHYGVTGIVVGALVPVLFADWYEAQRPEQKWADAASTLLWAFVAICLPILAIVVLGAKGASGIVVGLGLGGFVMACRKGSGGVGLAVILGAGCANALAVDWIGETMDLTRQEKLHSFGWWAVAMAVASAGILALSRRKAAKELS